MFASLLLLIQALPLAIDGLLSTTLITASPQKNFVVACIWGLLLFQSCLGYGGLILWKISRNDLLKSLAPVLGLGFYFTLGGWLNLLEIFHRPLILVVVYFGVLTHLFLVAKLHVSADQDRLVKFFQTSSWLKLVYILFFMIALAGGYLTAVGNYHFNVHDDFHGYLFFPQKLLQLGGLGVDPFSERRVVTGFGIGALWLAMGLVKISTSYIHVMDLGVGLLMAGYAIFYFPLKTSFQKSRFCLGIAIALMTFPIVNVTPNFLSIAVIMSIWLVFWLMTSQTQQFIATSKIYWFVLGICFFVLIGLKNTYIPYAAISFGLGMLYLWRVVKVPTRLFLTGIGIVGITVICSLIPWMLDLYRSSGTYFYPFLGKGVHASAYGYFPSATAQFMTASTWATDFLVLINPLGKSIFIINISLTLMALLMYWRSNFVNRYLLFFTLPLLSSLLNVLAVGYAIGGYGAYRYAYASALASLVSALLILMVITVEQSAGAVYRFAKQSLLIYCTIVLLMIRTVQDSVAYGKERWDQILESFYGADTICELSYPAYKNLSAAIPQNSGVLLRVDTPFLINSLHSKAFIADYPGSASPAPGMPVNQGPEALREYLLNQGVEYVVWGYANEANFKQVDYSERLGPKTHSWIRTEAKLAFEVQGHFEYFRAHYPNIYNQNGVVIIDLR